MSTEQIAIKTENLTRHFGSRVAVDSLNIEIRKGEIFSLLGENGAGKSTTIKMLSCLLQPTSGDATVMGKSIRKDPLHIKELIGVSPQDTAIAGHLTTQENLVLMGGVFGMKKAEASKRAKTLMTLMELEDRKDQARRLSGGLQRRLSIAMALMSDPQVLFLDEPTLGLDPHARRSVWNYIEKLKKEKTILLTTHYLEEADALADHMAIIHHGKIIESGTSPELKMKYAGKQSLKISAEKINPELIGALTAKDLEVTESPAGIEISSPELDFYAIMDLLKANHTHITGIQMQQPSLEDVFIHLTGQEDQQ